MTTTISRRPWSEDSPHQRFFAGLTGDSRQLWARDPRLPLDADLFYLERGAAETVRDAGLVPGVLQCPYPDCPYPLFKTAAGGPQRRDHFRHERNPDLSHTDAPALAYLGARVLRQWLRDRSFASVVIDRMPAIHGTERARLLRTWGPQLAFIVAGRPLLDAEIAVAVGDLPVGSRVIWIVAGVPGLLDRHNEDRLVSRFGARLARSGYSVIWLNANEQLIATPMGDPQIPFEVNVIELRETTLTRSGISLTHSNSTPEGISKADLPEMDGLSGADAMRTYVEWAWGRPDRALKMFDAIHAAFPEDVEFRAHFSACAHERKWAPAIASTSGRRRPAGVDRPSQDGSTVLTPHDPAPDDLAEDHMLDAGGIDPVFRLPARLEGLHAVRGYLQWTWVNSGRVRRAFHCMLESASTPSFRLLAVDYFTLAGDTSVALEQLDSAANAPWMARQSNGFDPPMNYRRELDRRRITVLSRLGRHGDAWATAQGAVESAVFPETLTALWSAVDLAAKAQSANVASHGTPGERKRFERELGRIRRLLADYPLVGPQTTVEPHTDINALKVVGTTEADKRAAAVPSASVNATADASPWGDDRIAKWMLALRKGCRLKDLPRNVNETPSQVDDAVQLLVARGLVEVSADRSVARCAPTARTTDSWRKGLGVHQGGGPAGGDPRYSGGRRPQSRSRPAPKGTAHRAIAGDSGTLRRGSPRSSASPGLTPRRVLDALCGAPVATLATLTRQAGHGSSEVAAVLRVLERAGAVMPEVSVREGREVAQYSITPVGRELLRRSR